MNKILTLLAVMMISVSCYAAVPSGFDLSKFESKGPYIVFNCGVFLMPIAHDATREYIKRQIDGHVKGILADKNPSDTKFNKIEAAQILNDHPEKVEKLIDYFEYYRDHFYIEDLSLFKFKGDVIY